ncbi:MAG: hypothetical protein ABSF34_11015, partial [Verrucomicrobiota bacterium]
MKSILSLNVNVLIGFTLSLVTGIKTREFPLLTLKVLPLLQMIRFLRAWVLPSGFTGVNCVVAAVTACGAYLLNAA